MTLTDPTNCDHGERKHFLRVTLPDFFNSPANAAAPSPAGACKHLV